MRRFPALLAAVLSLLICPPAFSQTATGSTPATRPGGTTGTQLPGMPPARDPRAPATGTARLRGRIVAAQTGAPLRRATVSLSSFVAPAARSTTTDGDGRFEFADLPAGRYTVSANKVGFVPLQYGQRVPTDPTTPFVLADGERRDGINLALPRGGVIAVRLTDDFGEPLPGAQVQVQRYQYGPDGQRRLINVFVQGSIGMSVTDDRGEIRIYGLSPGEYLVSASYRNQLVDNNPNATANSEGFSLTFHPGTVSATEAQAVPVRLAEETLVEFAMSPARLARVSGSAVDSQGRPAAGSFIQLMNRQANAAFGGGGGQVAPDGTFTLTGVAPGEYSLEVRPQNLAGRSNLEFGSTSVVVAGTDITGVRIVTGKGATITGRVIFEGTAPRGNAGQGQLRVYANAADPSRVTFAGITADPRTNGTLDENGNFQLTGMTGRVFLLVPTPGGWTTKSVTLDGEDITDEPLELTGKQSVTGVVIRMTDKLTQISGQVTDSRGQRTRECTVVFQSAEEREPIIAARLLRTLRCDSMGSFQTRGMRPGRYVVTAVTSIEQGRQFEPEFQKDLRRAGQSFAIREGETLTLDLKLTSGF